MNPFSYIIPDENTFFWKKIVISEIDQIHEEIKNYFEKIRPANERLSNHLYSYLDIKKTQNDCPILFNWAKNKNLQISATVVVDVPPAPGPGKFGIHVDTSNPITFPNQLALNFPILSCMHPDVWTSMYRCKGPLEPGGAFLRDVDSAIDLTFPNNIGKNGDRRMVLRQKLYYKDRQKSGQKVLSFPVDYSREMTRFQYVDKNPILFNAKIPHAVQNYSNEPRATLSLRFKTDPIWWI